MPRLLRQPGCRAFGRSCVQCVLLPGPREFPRATVESMKELRCTRKIWLSAFAAVAVGAAFLLAWELAHRGLPKGTLVVPRDAATIAEALQRVLPGGVIALSADEGPFAEPVIVRVAGITLRSVGRPAVLLGEGSTAVDVAADGVTVEGLVIRNASLGIVIAGTGCRVRNVTLESCDVGLRFLSGEGNLAQGITIADGHAGIEVACSMQTLRDIRCVSLSDVGIRLRDAVRAVVEDVSMEGVATGILAEECVEPRLARIRIVQCSRTGVEILGGNDAVVTMSEIRGAAVGLLLQASRSALVHSCRFAACEDSAILFTDARACRASSVDVRSCHTGIRVSGGGDNAITDGQLRSCGDASIEIEGSANALIARNVVSEGKVAISVSRSADVQILRNAVVSAQTCGIFLRESGHALALDNVVSDCGAGVVALSSDESLFQRNAIRGSHSAGLTLGNGLLGSAVTGNRLHGQPIGALVAGSSRDVLSENDILECETGILLHRIGYGIQLRENRIASNVVGLRWSDADLVLESLDALGFRAARTTSGEAPEVSGNEFRANRTYDIEAKTGRPLYAGGNAFRGADPAQEGRVAGDVRLPRLASKETVVIGAGASPTSRILGRLLGILLADEGFRVIDMAGFSSEEALLEALSSGDIDVGWCFGALEPYAFWEISARAGWEMVTTSRVADVQSAGASRLGLTAVSVIAAPGAAEDLVRQALGRAGFVTSAFRTAATAEAAETALQLGEVDVAVVDRIDEALTLAGFRTLGDGHILTSTSIKLVLSSRRVEGLREAFLKLAPRVTTEALRELVSRVRLLNRDPSVVALDFLLREALLADEAEEELR